MIVVSCLRRASRPAVVLGWTSLALLASVLLPDQPLRAQPVVCTTVDDVLPPSASGRGPAQLLAVTRCGPVQSSADLLQERFYTYTAPYARGVDLSHQITDLLGLARGGADGTRWMGLGFPEQTINWDGSAVAAATEALIQRQSAPIPWRTADQPNGYGPSGQVEGRSNPSWATPGGLPPRRSW